MIDNSGPGAGVEDIGLGFAKLHLAVTRNIPAGTEAAGTDDGPAQTNIDARLSDIAVGVGKLEVIAIEGTAGLNRVWWDLRYDPLKPVRLRVSPPGEPWVANGPQGYRRLVTWTSGAQVPQVAPGKYTVRLTVDGKSSTQALEVLPDPKSVAKPEQIEAQLNFLNGLVAELNQAADLINQLEWSRLQLQQGAQRVTGTPNADATIKSAHDLEDRMIAAEDQLVDHAEDGGVHANAEGENGDSGGGEAGGFEEKAEGEAQVLQE